MQTQFLRSFLYLRVATALLGSVSLCGQESPPDPFGCWKVLQQQDQRAASVVAAELNKLKTSTDAADSNLYKRFEKAGGGGSVNIIGIADFAGSGGNESEEQRKHDQKLFQSFDQFLNRASKAAINERKTSEEAISAWRDCMLANISPPPPLQGLELVVMEPSDQKDVKILISWRAPGGYTGSSPKIIDIYTSGVSNDAALRRQLLNKPLSLHQSIIQRKSANDENATITIVTDIWGSVSAILRKSEPQSDDSERWTKFLEDYRRIPTTDGIKAAATDGVFTNKIVLIWGQMEEVPHNGIVKHYDVWVTTGRDKFTGGSTPETAGDNDPRTRHRFRVYDPSVTQYVHDGLGRGQKLYYWLRPRWEEPGHPNKKDEDSEGLVPRVYGPFEGRTRD